MRKTGTFILFGLFLMGCATSPKLSAPASDHFDGEKFRNLEESKSFSFMQMLKFQAYLDSSWDEVTESTNQLDKKSEFPRPAKNKILYTKIGHSTVLIQTKNLNILTDPIWSERCGPNTWAGPLRVRPPAVKFENLPRIDVVVISHNHYDHMDLPTLHSLQDKFNPLIVVGLGNQNYLNENGIYNVIELDWWQQITVKGTVINFVPSQHISGRGFYDKFKTLWGGFVFQTKAGAIYFAGDTAYASFFKQIRQRFGPPILSFLPIGGYGPHWFMRNTSSNPEEAVMAHLELGSKMSESIHYETFKVSREGFGDPASALEKAKAKHSVGSSAFLASQFGKPVALSIQPAQRQQKFSAASN